jgi:hypothetical protein
MLLEFSVKNYLSFKDEVTLSLRGREGVTGHEGDSTFDVAGEPILKSAVIYGANASGKSNLIKAMQFIKHFVLNSAIGVQSESSVHIDNFKLIDKGYVNDPSLFEITFIHENKYYRYGFELDVFEIYREWLYQAALDAEQELCLFNRKYQTVKCSQSFEEAKSFIDGRERKKEYRRLKLVRRTALLLSVIAQFDGEISRKLMRWFKNNLNVLFASEEKSFKNFSEMKLEHTEFKDKILNFLKVADVNIDDAYVREVGQLLFLRKELQRDFATYQRPPNQIIVSHKLYDEYGVVTGEIEWIMDDNESEGTKKLFALSAPIIDALEHGKTLVIDELDSKLHPFMMTFILNLFHSTEKNPKNAQLIFNTHDVNLLSKRFFRRDQIWFTEKNEYGATELYSLADFKDLTDEGINNETFQNDYFQGRYGAVPLTGNLEIFKRDTDATKK